MCHGSTIWGGGRQGQGKLPRGTNDESMMRLKDE